VIYHITQFLDPNAETLLRLGYKFISFRAGMAFLLSMLTVIIFLPRSFNFFSKRGWVNRQRSYMIDSSSKEGVPVMGGMHIFMGAMISILLIADLQSRYVQCVLLAAISFFGLGLMDDFLKIKGGHADAGVSRAIKYFVQIGIGLGLGYLIISSHSPHPEALRGTLSLPFIKTPIHIGWWQILFSILVVIFISNAVNFADGMDGLATGPSLMTFFGLAIYAYILGHAIWSAHFLFFSLDNGEIQRIACSELVIPCCAIMGALMGFLWYNTYPATIFMGDCGSMFLGGVMAVIFVLLKQEFLFLIFGLFFVIEILSVFIQDYLGIKLLGRRIFYRAPYHENLKYLGYSEPKIVVRMWILSSAALALGLLSIKMR
jgi:phospho-N-acetylmuramoyl-pentapeptide-transferase